MRAITITTPGDSQVLNMADMPEPALKRDSQLLVRLKAAGINPIDTKIRGAMDRFPVQNPCILGCDGAGIVEAVGTQVKRFRPGDEVYFCQPPFNDRQGTYAELCVVDEAFVAPKPKSLDFAHAAAAPLVLITAWEALYDRAWLEDAQRVLIHAGAGGVGHVAIQLARAAGASVATTVSTPDKAALVAALGADRVIRYRDEDVVQAVMAWSEGTGADIVFDTLGDDVFKLSVSCAKLYGQLVTILTPPPDMDWSEARLRNLSVSQELMLSPTLLEATDAQRLQGNILRQCTRLFDNDELKIVVAKQFSLEQAAEAHRFLEDEHPAGKLVLTID
ncbi:MAG: zinc-dependent alcohol dehydrogenase family protein [Granulosicoccaceae bacterium]|jgi:NADPH2:quinone reductase